MNDVEVLYIEFDDVITSCDKNQFFARMVKSFKNECPWDRKQNYKFEKLLPMFKWNGKRYLYNQKLCVPRKAVPITLHIMIPSLAVILRFERTTSRLGYFYWRHEAHDVKIYDDGCIVCQQYKDSNKKKITEL